MPKKLLMTSLLCTMFVLGVVLSTWLRSFLPQPSLDTVEAVTARVAAHYVLPADEQPALLTVVDAEKLSSNYLKSFAQTGDKILLYKYHQRTIIYRPNIDKIVDIGPVIVESLKSNEQ